MWVWHKGWAGTWHAMRMAGCVGVTGNKLNWCHTKSGNLVVFLAHSTDKFPMQLCIPIGWRLRCPVITFLACRTSARSCWVTPGSGLSVIWKSVIRGENGQKEGSDGVGIPEPMCHPCVHIGTGGGVGRVVVDAQGRNLFIGNQTTRSYNVLQTCHDLEEPRKVGLWLVTHRRH